MYVTYLYFFLNVVTCKLLLVYCCDHLCWTSSICHLDALSTRLSTLQADLHGSCPGSPLMSHWIPMSSRHPQEAVRWEGSRFLGFLPAGAQQPGCVPPCWAGRLAALCTRLFSLALLTGHSQPLPLARHCTMACGLLHPAF